MKENTHTPGKWSLQTTRNKEIRMFTDIAGGMYIGTLDLAGNDDIKQANAKLIAACPDLLEACNKMYSILSVLARHQAEGWDVDLKTDLYKLLGDIDPLIKKLQPEIVKE